MTIVSYNKQSIPSLAPSLKSQIILLDQNLEDLSWSKKLWNDTWEDFGHFFLQVYVEDDMVTAFGLWTLPPLEDVVHLLKIVVSPLHRGKGLAGQLFEDIVQIFPTKGIYLEVKANNTVAIKFYQKYGLKILTRTRNYYGLGLDAYKMFKPALPNA